MPTFNKREIIDVRLSPNDAKLCKLDPLFYSKRTDQHDINDLYDIHFICIIPNVVSISMRMEHSKSRGIDLVDPQAGNVVFHPGIQAKIVELLALRLAEELTAR